MSELISSVYLFNFVTIETLIPEEFTDVCF